MFEVYEPVWPVAKYAREALKETGAVSVCFLKRVVHIIDANDTGVRLRWRRKRPGD